MDDAKKPTPEQIAAGMEAAARLKKHFDLLPEEDRMAVRHIVASMLSVLMAHDLYSTEKWRAAHRICITQGLGLLVGVDGPEGLKAMMADPLAYVCSALDAAVAARNAKADVPITSKGGDA